MIFADFGGATQPIIGVLVTEITLAQHSVLCPCVDWLVIGWSDFAEDNAEDGVEAGEHGADKSAE